MPRQTTQTERVLEYMIMFGSITPIQALQDLGCMRLASRISDLKKMGHKINSTTVASKNRFGETTHFSVYSLAAEVD